MTYAFYLIFNKTDIYGKNNERDVSKYPIEFPKGRIRENKIKVLFLFIILLSLSKPKIYSYIHMRYFAKIKGYLK